MQPLVKLRFLVELKQSDSPDVKVGHPLPPLGNAFVALQLERVHSVGKLGSAGVSAWDHLIESADDGDVEHVGERGRLPAQIRAVIKIRHIAHEFGPDGELHPGVILDEDPLGITAIRTGVSAVLNLAHSHVDGLLARLPPQQRCSLVESVLHAA